jgi:hypothetical protein
MNRGALVSAKAAACPKTQPLPPFSGQRAEWPITLCHDDRELQSGDTTHSCLVVCANSFLQQTIPSMLKRHGRPYISAGGRPCVALRTPTPILLDFLRRETRARKAAPLCSSGDRLYIPATCAPHFNLDSPTWLVTRNTFPTREMVQPLEIWLARPTRALPLTWRAVQVRWTKVFHH